MRRIIFNIGSRPGYLYQTEIPKRYLLLHPPSRRKRRACGAQKELPDIVPSRPTAAEIAQRAEESADIKFLLLETQNKLGRTIGYDGQCTLLMMHDTYGIPVEVILMIIEYAVSIGKSSFHYIASIGKDWGEREIDTIEKADEQISRLNSVNRVWASFAAMAGLSNSRPTQTQTKYIVTWNREWGFSTEMIFWRMSRWRNTVRK